MEGDRKGFLAGKRIAVTITAGMTKFFPPKVHPISTFVLPSPPPQTPSPGGPDGN